MWEDKDAPNPRALRDLARGPGVARLRALTHQRLRHEPLYLSAPSERKRPEPGLAAFASPIQTSALSGDHQHDRLIGAWKDVAP